MFAAAIVVGHYNGHQLTMSGWGLVFGIIIAGAAARDRR